MCELLSAVLEHRINRFIPCLVNFVPVVKAILNFGPILRSGRRNPIRSWSFRAQNQQIDVPCLVNSVTVEKGTLKFEAHSVS